MGPVIDNDAADHADRELPRAADDGRPRRSAISSARSTTARSCTPALIDMTDVARAARRRAVRPDPAGRPRRRLRRGDRRGERHALRPVGVADQPDARALRPLLGQHPRRHRQLEPPDQRRLVERAVRRRRLVGQPPPQRLLRRRLLRLSGRQQRSRAARARSIGIGLRDGVTRCRRLSRRSHALSGFASAERQAIARLPRDPRARGAISADHGNASSIPPRAGASSSSAPGPGDPGLLTVRAVEALASADVVVHDGLIDPRVLDLAPADRAAHLGRQAARAPHAAAGGDQRADRRARADRRDRRAAEGRRSVHLRARRRGGRGGARRRPAGRGHPRRLGRARLRGGGDAAAHPPRPVAARSASSPASARGWPIRTGRASPARAARSSSTWASRPPPTSPTS